MKNLKTIVVKIGTKVITAGDKTLDKEKLKDIIGQIADILDKDSRVIVVTSGAIGAGMGLLGLKKRPVKGEELQACASIGQSHLMHLYGTLFKERGYHVGQILLTQEDFNDRKRYLNIKYTIDALLAHKAIPIINENDTVSTEEIKCGDNDRLSSLVADLCGAGTLVLLTDVDGLMDEGCNVVSFVDDISPRILKLARSSRCELGTGGMASKLDAVRKAASSGIECVIANGRTKNILNDIFDGKSVGTRFKASVSKMLAKKRWIAYSSKSKGTLVVDAGAKNALLLMNKSLLASGVVSVSGHFVSGDVVKISQAGGHDFAKGRANYSSAEIAKIKGLRTSEIRQALGYKGADEVIHKDNLVIL